MSENPAEGDGRRGDEQRHARGRQCNSQANADSEKNERQAAPPEVVRVGALEELGRDDRPAEFGIHATRLKLGGHLAEPGYRGGASPTRTVPGV